MITQLQASRYQNFRLKCRVPGCTFSGHIPGIVHITEADLELLADLLNPLFVPTPEQAARLDEIIGPELTCPNHKHQDIGLEYEFVTNLLATLE